MVTFCKQLINYWKWFGLSRVPENPLVFSLSSSVQQWAISSQLVVNGSFGPCGLQIFSSGKTEAQLVKGIFPLKLHSENYTNYKLTNNNNVFNETSIRKWYSKSKIWQQHCVDYIHMI